MSLGLQWIIGPRGHPYGTMVSENYHYPGVHWSKLFRKTKILVFFWGVLMQSLLEFTGKFSRGKEREDKRCGKPKLFFFFLSGQLSWPELVAVHSALPSCLNDLVLFCWCISPPNLPKYWSGLGDVFTAISLLCQLRRGVAPFGPRVCSTPSRCLRRTKLLSMVHKVLTNTLKRESEKLGQVWRQC